MRVGWGLVSCLPGQWFVFVPWLIKGLEKSQSTLSSVFFPSVNLYLSTNDILTIINGIWKELRKSQTLFPQTP